MTKVCTVLEVCLQNPFSWSDANCVEYFDGRTFNPATRSDRTIWNWLGSSVSTRSPSPLFSIASAGFSLFRLLYNNSDQKDFNRYLWADIWVTIPVVVEKWNIPRPNLLVYAENWWLCKMVFYQCKLRNDNLFTNHGQSCFKVEKRYVCKTSCLKICFLSHHCLL